MRFYLAFNLFWRALSIKIDSIVFLVTQNISKIAEISFKFLKISYTWLELPVTIHSAATLALNISGNSSAIILNYLVSLLGVLDTSDQTSRSSKWMLFHDSVRLNICLINFVDFKPKIDFAKKKWELRFEQSRLVAMRAAWHVIASVRSILSTQV